MKKSVLKKLISVLTIFLLLITALVGCNKKVAPNPQPDIDTGKYIATNEYAKVWAAPNTVSIMQDVSVDLQCEYWGNEWLDDADKLYCDGIKGDTEAVQVMMTAKKDISSFYFTASDLISEDGTATIEKSNIEVFAERYIEVKASSSSSRKASMFTGFYPDALVPISSYKARKENKVSKGNNQGIWLNINIPQDAEAGMYSADCSLTIDDTAVTVPLTVKVYDIEMPSVTHATTSFAIWYDQIGRGEEYEDEDGNSIDWEKNYYDFLLSKKVTPQTTQLLNGGNITVGSDCKAQVDEIIKLAKNDKVTSYDLPYRGTTVAGIDSSVVDKNLLVTILTAMANRNIELRKNGDDVDLFKKAYFYFGSIIDEPSVSNMAAVRYCDLAVTNSKKEVAELLNDYPDLKESLLKVRHVVTTSVRDAFAGDEEIGGVQTWCCEDQNYTGEALNSIIERQNSSDRYAYGEDFWIYMTCNSNNPFPSLQLDDNLMGVRTLFWMNYNYNITGTLYWNVCYYSAYSGGQSGERDIWNNPLTWESANGDGALLYPGTRYGLLTPLATLRLESLRQGIEDYEYLYMFGDILQKYNEKHSTSYDADTILNNFYKNVFYMGTVQAKTNVKNFSNARSQLLQLLEEMSKDSSTAATLLQNYSSNN